MTWKATRQVDQVLATQAGKATEYLKKSLKMIIPVTQKVMEQSRRRIRKNEKVPAQEKIGSIFRAHVDIIYQEKESKLIEYGHKIWLDEVAGENILLT